MKIKISKSQWEALGKRAVNGEGFVPKEIQDIAERITGANPGTSIVSVGKGAPSNFTDSYKITFSTNGLTQNFCRFIADLGVDCAIYNIDGNYVLLVWHYDREL